jgi:hypothetical protein
MAITIDEMHVEVQAPAPALGAPAIPEPKKQPDPRELMELVCERNLRLRAD